MNIWTMIEIRSILLSDLFIPFLLIFPCMLFGFRIYPYIRKNKTDSFAHNLSTILLPWLSRQSFTPFSTQRAAQAYEQYYQLSSWDIRAMQKSYGRIRRAHKRIGYDIGYPNKLLRLEQVIRINAKLTSAIATMSQPIRSSTTTVDGGDLVRIREALKHFVRDWSEEGKEERNRIFKPCLDFLCQIDESERKYKKVLVPGCGLGRIAWEIAQLGFNTTANELSGFMILAFKFLITESMTQTPFQHLVHPYAHWFSHQRTNSSMFRSIHFPDTVPRLTSNFHLLEADFLNLPTPVSQKTDASGYDIIVTVFFIDTALNIIQTLEQIYRLLLPGGIWLNIGPLLWTGGSQASLELSLEELFHLMRVVGFDIDERSRRTVDCEYTADNEAMMKWIYNAEFWSARKPSSY